MQTLLSLVTILTELSWLRNTQEIYSGMVSLCGQLGGVDFKEELCMKLLCEVWPLTLREEHRLRVFWEQGAGGRKLRESGEHYIVRGFVICSLRLISLG
jgi:hypothetical protein